MARRTRYPKVYGLDDGTVSSELRAQMDRRGRNAAFVEALRQHHPAREEPLGSGLRPEERPLVLPYEAT